MREYTKWKFWSIENQLNKTIVDIQLRYPILENLLYYVLWKLKEANPQAFWKQWKIKILFCFNDSISPILRGISS